MPLQEEIRAHTERTCGDTDKEAPASPSEMAVLVHLHNCSKMPAWITYKKQFICHNLECLEVQDQETGKVRVQ